MVKTILGIINNKEKRDDILNLCSRLSIKYTDILFSDLNTPIGQIIGLLGNSLASNLDQRKAPALYIPPEILIFCGFTDPELDQFIDLYNGSNIPQIPLKGVITPFNITWTVYELILEYEEESRPNSTL